MRRSTLFTSSRPASGARQRHRKGVPATRVSTSRALFCPMVLFALLVLLLLLLLLQLMNDLAVARGGAAAPSPSYSFKNG